MTRTAKKTESSSIKPRSQDYDNASKNFRSHWTDINKSTELARKEMINMVVALKELGYTHGEVINKIIEDHQDLKGFSKTHLYRQLPKELKDSNKGRPVSVDYSELINNNKVEELGQPNFPFGKLGQPNANTISYEFEEKEPDGETDTITTNTKILPSPYEVKDAETSVDQAVDEVYDMDDDELYLKKPIKNSNDNNPQPLTGQMNPFPNYDLPQYERKTPSEKLDQKTDLPSDKIDGLIRWHLEVIIDNYRQLWIEINKMIRKLQEENPKWKLDKIIYTIYAYYEDTKNYILFSPAIIMKNLDTENKELFGIFTKVDKPIQDMKSIEDMR